MAYSGSPNLHLYSVDSKAQNSITVSSLFFFFFFLFRLDQLQNQNTGPIGASIMPASSRIPPIVLPFVSERAKKTLDLVRTM